MGLADWTIKLAFNRDDDSYGWCSPVVEYKTADINIDTSHNPMDVPEVMRHELAHCVVAELAHFAEVLCGDDAKAEKLLAAAEDTVCSRIAAMPRFRGSGASD